jgi:hypothetical protein
LGFSCKAYFLSIFIIGISKIKNHLNDTDIENRARSFKRELTFKDDNNMNNHTVIDGSVIIHGSGNRIGGGNRTDNENGTYLTQNLLSKFAQNQI